MSCDLYLIIIIIIFLPSLKSDLGGTSSRSQWVHLNHISVACNMSTHRSSCFTR